MCIQALRAPAPPKRHPHTSLTSIGAGKAKSMLDSLAELGMHSSLGHQLSLGCWVASGEASVVVKSIRGELLFNQRQN